MEFLGSGEALRRWLRQAESVHERPFCPSDAAWTPEHAASALPHAWTLRAALDGLVRSVLAKEPAPAAARDAVNAVLRANPTYPRIDADTDGFRESLLTARPEDAWIATIAVDAVDLLCHSDLSLLRQCECAVCVRVFYDTTKNHRRRWCVEKCGSSTKAAAYYRRKVARTRPAETSA